MPNRRTHVVGGIATGLAVGLATMEMVEEKDRWLHVLSTTLSATIGALLPDIIEPALHPNHRGSAHSLAAGLSVGAIARARRHADCLRQSAACERRAAEGAKDSAAWQTEMRNARLGRLAAAAILGLIAGYASHLVLDGTTAKGLPLLVRGM